MNRLFIFFLLSFVFVSCDNEPESQQADSPFEAFIGVWNLESRTVNGTALSLSSAELMKIKEDADLNNDTATGYYEEGTPIEREDITLELPDAENEIILRKSNVIFFCTYTFDGADKFKLTDFFEGDSSTVVTTWIR